VHNVVRLERLHRVDLAARAREHARTGSRSGIWLSGFALVGLLALRPIRDSPRGSFGSLSAQRSLARSGRRARTPSLFCRALGLFRFSHFGRIGSEPSGTRGARPFGDPGPFDRRLQLTIMFSRNACSSSRCTPCRVSPRGTGTLDSRRRAHFSELNRILGALSSPIAPAVRTSDASSLRGLPGGARLRPPASARRSSCDDPRVVPESLGFLRHAA
jgi:hypothetical protein